MKKLWASFAIMLLAISVVVAQNVSVRSDEFDVNKQQFTTTLTAIPTVKWITPVAETSYIEPGRFRIHLEIDSDTPLAAVTIDIIDPTGAEDVKTLRIEPKEEEKKHMVIEKNLSLMEGDHHINITAESKSGLKTYGLRKVHAGGQAMSDLNKLNRTDYALIFATDEYDHWPHLVNPIFDSKTVGEDLEKTYNFKVDLVENATQTQILNKIREYIEKKYQPLDQLFILFAGHGTYDQTLGEGFVVTKESLPNDEGKISYLSHNRLRSSINRIPCEHIFLTMDVCFGGTFDAVLASSRGVENEVYKEKSASEFIVQKLTNKTRKFLTSGGKKYVSDGIEGQHSPFARAFLEALRSKGGSDGILTLAEITPYVEKLKITPHSGEFGDNAPGSDFLFIAH
jgi:hypothetical protein